VGWNCEGSVKVDRRESRQRACPLTGSSQFRSRSRGSERRCCIHGMLVGCFIAPGDWAIWSCAAFCVWSELRAHLMLALAAAMEPRQCSGSVQARLDLSNGSTVFPAQIPRRGQHCTELELTTCTRAGRCASGHWLLVWPLPSRFEYLPVFHGGPGARHRPRFGANPPVVFHDFPPNDSARWSPTSSDKDAERDRKDGRTVAGCRPDLQRTYAGCTPDGIQVAHATPGLTRSVRDGVFLQVRS
jgi:hypothetical protein